MEKSSTPQTHSSGTPVPNYETPKTALAALEHISTPVQPAFQELKLEISNLRNELREQIKEHFFQNQVDRKFTAQATRSNVRMDSFNLWQETQKKLERIDEVTQTGFGLLLTNDEFTQRFLMLQRENQTLKRRIAELEQRAAGGSEDGDL